MFDSNLAVFVPGRAGATGAAPAAPVVSAPAAPATAHPGLHNPHVQPALMETAFGSVHYRQAKGPLFVGRPKASDVAQHGAADCYLMSSLAETAQQRPSLIKNAIHKNGDGTFTVTLYDVPQHGPIPDPPKKVQIRVDGKLPTRDDDGSLAYANQRTSQALWPELMEKAYAKLQGGYDAIGHTGQSTRVLEALTGKPAQKIYTADAQSPKQLFHRISTALTNGQMVTAGSHPNGEPAGSGIVKDHCYSILGASRDANGKPVLELRNPWGHHEPGNDGTDDGIFTLPLSDFMARFSGVMFST